MDLISSHFRISTQPFEHWPKALSSQTQRNFETLEFTRIGGAVPNRGSEAIPPAVGGHAGGQEAFERGGRVARIALAQSQDAAEAAAGSSPKEPCREQDAKDISLPLKTTISSRMSTICPMTALNPISARAVLTAGAGHCEWRMTTCFCGVSTERN